jgi:predicted nuclease of predicted toxin-antitoxin system
MRLYLDEDVPVAVAEAVRRHKVDVVTTREAGNEHASDRAQLAFATEEGRCILTRNIRDFTELAAETLQQQRPHAGIILISGAYRGNEIRRITEGILRVVRNNPRGLEEYGVRYLARAG